MYVFFLLHSNCRTIASDVKLCANMPSFKLHPGIAAQHANHTLSTTPNSHPELIDDIETNRNSETVVDHGGSENGNNPTAAQHAQHTLTTSQEGARKLDRKLSRAHSTSAALSMGVRCPNVPIKLAYITPYLPRADGLSYYAANLRGAIMSACPNIKVSSILKP